MNIKLNGKTVMLPIMENLKVNDDVLILISPEDIFIMLEPQESSVRNIVEGKIVGMELKTDMVRLNVAIDEKINVLVDITQYSRERLDLNLDKKVYIGFKATSISVVKI